MTYNSESFTEAWIRGTLGRKLQCGNFYVQKFPNAEFLCFNGAEKWAFLIGMKCYETGIVVLDKRNHDLLAWPTDLVNPVGYKTSFATLSELTKNGLQYIKVVDHTSITTEDGLKASLVLYDIDGYKFYTELAEELFCNKQEFLSMKDMETTNTKTVFTLHPTENTCTKVEDARISSIPSAARNEDFKVLNSCFLLAEPDKTFEIAESVWTKARWQPAVLGWGLPPEIVSRDQASLIYSWAPHYMTLDEFSVKMKKFGEAGKRAARWRQVYEDWKGACKHIMSRTTVSYDGCGFMAGTENSWQETEYTTLNNGQREVVKQTKYVRGSLEIPKEAADDKPQFFVVDLGNIWHRVYQR